VAIIHLTNQVYGPTIGGGILTPGRMVNLLELLRVYGKNYVRLANCISLITAALSVKDADVPSEDMVISALGLFDGIRPQLVEAGLSNTVSQMERAEKTWNSYRDYGVFSSQCAEVLNRLEDELKARVLLMVPHGVQSIYESPRSGWEESISRFLIVDNVEEMNRCFAFGRYAASVFHSLLIAEAGLIELGRHIGVIDPKAGWDATSNRLSALVRSGRKGHSLAVSFNSLEQINQSVESMKLAWRNKVNHEANRLVVMTPDFSEPVAQEIIMATRGFMRRLATEIPRLPNEE
jgi:hypothetical protein